MAEHTKARPWLLLLEDEAELVAILRENLKDDFQIEAADNVAAAVELLEARRFDIILSDLMLPGKENGLDFLQLAMRRQPEARRILMSGYLNPELLVRSISLAELSACLMKPVEISVLRKELHAALARRSAPQS